MSPPEEKQQNEGFTAQGSQSLAQELLHKRTNNEISVPEDSLRQAWPDYDSLVYYQAKVTIADYEARQAREEQNVLVAADEHLMHHFNKVGTHENAILERMRNRALQRRCVGADAPGKSSVVSLSQIRRRPRGICLPRWISVGQQHRPRARGGRRGDGPPCSSCLAVCTATAALGPSVARRNCCSAAPSPATHTHTPPRARLSWITHRAPVQSRT
ncbi:hypothetical protein LX36DRAFT_246734 [Colletotrichum falcatum]|nr:hypothetical protein LX36DRAFT_246734 [Colletotrichum falcatum]